MILFIVVDGTKVLRGLGLFAPEVVEAEIPKVRSGNLQPCHGLCIAHWSPIPVEQRNQTASQTLFPNSTFLALQKKPYSTIVCS